MIKSEQWWVQRTPEHPRKISAFRECCKKLTWPSTERRASVSILFNKIDELAEFELKYYYRRRNTRALISTIARLGGWAFGAAGLLLPLLAATDPSRKDWAAWGYVALAAAGSCFGANALFGGTSGHASFVAAQLAIERLIIENRLAWAKVIAETQPQPGASDQLDDAQLTAALDLIHNYTKSVYTITANETENWRNSTLEELSKSALLIKK